MKALELHLSLQLEHSRDFFWNRIRWELVLAHLPVGPIELVDVGAGTGFLGDFLRERRPEIAYRFVEPLEQFQSQLEERFGLAANLHDRVFGDAACVTLMDVLEHQSDDHDFMVGLASKMAPGCTLLLTVPALPWLWSDWDKALGHYRRYTKSALGGLVGGLPFDVVEQSYLFPELIPLGAVRRLRAANTGEAQFPRLPHAINEVSYRIGRATTAVRRYWPAGTSLFAVLRRT